MRRKSSVEVSPGQISYLSDSELSIAEVRQFLSDKFEDIAIPENLVWLAVKSGLNKTQIIRVTEKALSTNPPMDFKKAKALLGEEDRQASKAVTGSY